ncbi:MAG: hypothetical protein WCB27_15055 [Thermoguttaceae bacterium]
MKTRESGMPSEEVRERFFKPEETLRKLAPTTDCTGVVDFGGGDGTFTIPAARIVRSIVYALLQLSFVRQLTAASYAAGHGRPSIDPEVCFRMLLVAYLYSSTSTSVMQTEATRFARPKR